VHAGELAAVRATRHRDPAPFMAAAQCHSSPVIRGFPSVVAAAAPRADDMNVRGAVAAAVMPLVRYRVAAAHRFPPLLRVDDLGCGESTGQRPYVGRAGVRVVAAAKPPFFRTRSGETGQLAYARARPFDYDLVVAPGAGR